jgi:prolyl-tRNA synthetase
VPFRIEIGPRDVAAKSVVVVDRLSREKTSVEWSQLSAWLVKGLDDFQDRLFQRAIDTRASFAVEVTTREELDAAFAGGKNALARGPWCGRQECELEIKDATKGVTIRVIESDASAAAGSCAGCGQPAKHWVYWARAY